MKSELKNEKFSDYELNTEILRDIAQMGYDNPTPIQARCIPPTLKGRDVIGLAQTGTGKTAAFGLPIIHRVARKMDMAALILAPTRELAQQTNRTLRELGKSSGIRVALLVGGVPLKEDHKMLRSWPNVAVATPGRLIDHIYSRTIDLSQIEMLAVDEADRMYEMGFLPQIQQIIEALPAKRQTLMFTATMPKKVESLVRRHMRSPVRVQISVNKLAARAQQKLFRVDEQDKLSLLMELLGQSRGRVLVFARTKRKVDQLAREIAARKIRATRLHGDREQYQRETAMAGFRDGKYRILIATDIVARGIDVAGIEHVINYDFPSCAEDYIHRIGRTARVAASGLATSFVTKKDLSCLAHLERLVSTRLSLTPAGSHKSQRTLSPVAADNTRRRNSRRCRYTR